MVNWRDKSIIPWKATLTRSLAAVLCAADIVLVVMYLEHLGAAIFYCSLALMVALLILSAGLRDTTKPLYKLVFSATILLTFTAVTYIALYYSGVLAKISSADELRRIISDSGSLGIVVFFLLTLLQVVILPIPAAVTIVLGVLIYGPTVSFLVSSAGTIAGSVICFLLGKFFGYKVVAWIIGKEKSEKYSKVINEKGKIPFIVMMLFPFFPDDILCMAAGLTKMTFRFFIITIVLTRPVAIAFFSYFGTGEIIPFRGWGIPVWIALIALSVFLLYLINYLLKKRKTKKEEKHQNDDMG